MYDYVILNYHKNSPSEIEKRRVCTVYILYILFFLSLVGLRNITIATKEIEIKILCFIRDITVVPIFIVALGSFMYENGKL